MRTFLLFIALSTSTVVAGQTEKTAMNNARTISFDYGWTFSKSNEQNAFKASFNDTRWRKIDLPHDWSIEDLPGQGADSNKGPFSTASAGGPFTGHTVGGTAWYRKKFILPAASAGKSVYIQFDGVYTLAEVWINGHYLGYHPNGYTPFFYNIAPFLQVPGKTNLIAVRVKNEGRNSRWYSGSGIYRHVWLTIASPIHIAPMGIYVSTPLIDPARALIRIEATVVLPAGTKDITIRTRLLAPDRTVAATASSKPLRFVDNTAVITQETAIRNPQLWSTRQPQLYAAIVYVLSGNKILDSSTATFGIRSVHMDAEKGLLLNGERIILKGGCVHHDNGPLGAAAIDRADERKLEILKANGYNAIRTSHNPPSPNFLDVCDRLGLLVIDEAFDVWEHKKLFEDAMDYHHFFKEWWQKDMRAFIKRDRNHPSVIIWSIGNEIYERADTSGLRIARELIKEIHDLDSSRKITQGLCWFWDHPGRPWDSLKPAFALLDVGGYNYEYRRYADDHAKFPARIMVGTETYAKEAFANFDFAEKHPYVLGDFLWTAWDYIGEAGIGHTLLQPDTVKEDKTMLQPWPWFNAWCGDIDLIGQKKPQSYYRDVVWRNTRVELMVQRPAPEGMHYIPNSWGWPEELKSWTWNGREGKTMQVSVFSRSPRVRLILNDSIIAEKNTVDSTLTASFNVTYRPGILKAVALENGTAVGSDSLKTAGTAAKINLHADRRSILQNRNNLVYVSVYIVDKDGNPVPDIELPIQFTTNSAGSIAAVANGNPKDMTSFRQPVKTTFGGKALVIVRPEKKGKIIVTARGKGLQDGMAEIVVE